MAVVARVNLETYKQYMNSTVRVKLNGKKHQVYFKLVCDDEDIEECLKVGSNALMLEYIGSDDCDAYRSAKAKYIGRTVRCGTDLSESEAGNVLSEIPDGVVPIIELPEDFCDMGLLWKISKSYSKVRFCGGNLFAISGVRCGAIGVDILDAEDIKYDISSYHCTGTDVIPEINLSEYELEVVAKKESVRKVGESKPKAEKKPKLSFASLMTGGASVAP